MAAAKTLATAEVELDIQPTRVQLAADNLRLAAAIRSAVRQLEEIHGAGQDVEALIAEIRDDLAAAVDDRR